MNSNELEGRWKQMRGVVKEKWGKLTDDDFTTIGGKKDQFVGKLQARYGMSKEQAEKDLDSWLQGVKVGEETHTRTSGGGH